MTTLRNAYELCRERIRATGSMYDVSESARYGARWTPAECRAMDAQRDAALAADRRTLARLSRRLGWTA